jgi:hypothetical protein
MAHTAPDPSTLVEVDAPVLKRLIGRTFLPHQTIPLIESIMSKDGVQMINDLHGDDAQTFIDVIHEVRSTALPFLRHSLTTAVLLGPLAFKLSTCVDQALDHPDLPSQLRRECLRMLSRICGPRALLPRSLQIPHCYNRLDDPLYYGGFADVWKGEHQGCPVAVKVLKVYQTSDFAKVKIASHPDLVQMVS